MGSLILKQNHEVQERRIHKNVLGGIALAMLLGILTFVILYGTAPLHVTNDAWIMAGYDETDIIQHYSGWLAFRNSEWTFPIGIAGDMAYGQGTCISFTDSVPWAAILCKLVSPLLPETFQYFGLYALLCYVLQSVAGYLIVYRKSHSVGYSLLGAVLFDFAPIMMERSMRHVALGSQWLVLLAILLWLRHRDQRKGCHYVGYLALLVLTIGIHPYFLPMIAVFLFLTVTEDLRVRRWLSVPIVLAELGITYVTGCCIGVLGSGVQSSRDGYGYYCMNLNAMWNPSSLGGYTWSAVLKVLPQTLGNYDGFNYLGFGMIVGITLTIAAALAGNAAERWHKVTVRNARISGNHREAGEEQALPVRNADASKECRTAGHYGIAMLMMVFCTLFAISNVVTWNDQTLFTIPLPERVLEVCGIFRASSRLFYPVYYCIMTAVIYRIWELGKGRKGSGTFTASPASPAGRSGVSGADLRADSCIAFAVLALVVIVQLWDLHGCIREKHEQMQEKAVSSSVLQEPELNDIMANTDAFMMDGYCEGTRALSVPALKHHMRLYFSTANSGNYDVSSKLSADIEAKIKATGAIGTNLIITMDWDTALEYLQYENIGYYERNGLYYLCDRSLTGVVTREGLTEQEEASE